VNRNPALVGPVSMTASSTTNTTPGANVNSSSSLHISNQSVASKPTLNISGGIGPSAPSTKINSNSTTASALHPHTQSSLSAISTTSKLLVQPSTSNVIFNKSYNAHVRDACDVTTHIA
jgi:hypothetical protein